MSYLIPGPRTEQEKQAVAHVAELMAQGELDREDEALEREANAAEDKQFDPASASESPSTTRIVEQWRSEREGRDDDDLNEDAEALAGLPGGELDSDAAERTRRAIESVSERMASGVVRYADDDAVEGVLLDDYPGVDDELRGDFPADSPPIEQAAPAPAAAAAPGDGWDGGERNPEPLRASEPPGFSPG